MQRIALQALACLLAVAGGAAADTALCRTYIIQSGDSLWSIANANNVLQDDLMTALQQCINYNSQTALQVGEQICLPPWQPACTYVSDSAGVADCKLYRVQMGDTLASIASTFGLYAPDFASLNSDLYSGTGPLAVGTYLRLPPWDSSVCPDPGSNAPSCRVYQVAPGDSIFQIAVAFSITTDALLAVNSGLTTSTVLSPGQKIKIPPFPTKCGAGTVVGAPTDGVINCRGYVVQKGDSIAYIALKFAITTSDIVSANPELADPSLLTPGKTIKLPPFPDSCIQPVLVTGNNVSSPFPSATVLTSSPPTTASPSPLPTVAATSPPPAAASSPKPSSPTPSPAAAPAAAPAVAPASSSPALAPAPSEMTDAAAPDVSTVVVPTAPAPEVAMSTVSGATGVGPSLMLLLAMFAGVIARC